MAVADEPVSRAGADVLFEISAAASERSDNGQFDDLFAKAIVHQMTKFCLDVRMTSSKHTHMCHAALSIA